MSTNRDRIALIASKLVNLNHTHIFVGGVIRELVTTDPAAAPPRPTYDIDLIVPGIESPSRKLGFREDEREGAPRCRWVVEEITVDVMPVDPRPLGYTNHWYESAQHHAQTTHWQGTEIRHLDAPHFCATKLEAFKSRGGGDYYHHDLEDFIGLIDERETLLDEIDDAPIAVKDFLAAYTAELLAQSEFQEALPGHLNGDAASQGRLPEIKRRLNRLAALGHAVG